jgi:hypothetical protein
MQEDMYIGGGILRQTHEPIPLISQKEGEKKHMPLMERYFWRRRGHVLGAVQLLARNSEVVVEERRRNRRDADLYRELLTLMYLGGKVFVRASKHAACLDHFLVRHRT